MSNEWEVHNKKMMREARERRARVFGQRLSGKSFEEIGEKFGVSKQRAYQLYHKGRSEFLYNIITSQGYWMKKGQN